MYSQLADVCATVWLRYQHISRKEMSMYTLFKENKPMIATIISGILILFGIFLSYVISSNLAPFIFVLSFIIGGYHQAKEGFYETFKEKRLNVDILMVLAAIGASIIGYWMEGALLIFIFSLSGSLEIMATNKSTQAITDLMNVTPNTAKLILPDQTIKEVSTESLEVGNKILVPKGSTIPIDSYLIKGDGLIDESSITGESIPSQKKIGDELIGGTLNLSHALTLEVAVDSSNTLFAKIIRMVEEAQGTPSKTATLIEKIENKYVVGVLILVPLMIALFYFGLNWTWNESFYRGMVLLTVASPCALVASATPATLSAISNGAKKGILFKGGAYLENFSQIKAIAFDKTGTLTKGEPSVTDSNYLSDENVLEVDKLVLALEKTTTHPLGHAIVTYLIDKKTVNIELESSQEVTGKGIEGFYKGNQWKIGKLDYISPEKNHPLLKEAHEKQKEGKTVTFVSKNNALVAFFALMDVPKNNAKETVAFFKSKNIRTILITGDNEATGKSVGETLGVDETYANYLPDQKADLIKELKDKYEIIAMVGDGTNDAPALANASIGVAMGAGTDIAIDVADVVLMQDDISQLPYSFNLSNRLRRITLQNIVFSLAVIFILITANLIQVINLPLGVIGHEGSTILVILNGLRLLKKK